MKKTIDPTYESLAQELHDIYDIQPNSLVVGPLTRAYKKIAPSLKHFPFKVLLPCAVIVSLVGYLILHNLFPNFISLLQYGF